jgi:hypothetical protein
LGCLRAFPWLGFRTALVDEAYTVLPDVARLIPLESANPVTPRPIRKTSTARGHGVGMRQHYRPMRIPWRCHGADSSRVLLPPRRTSTRSGGLFCRWGWRPVCGQDARQADTRIRVCRVLTEPIVTTRFHSTVNSQREFVRAAVPLFDSNGIKQLIRQRFFSRLSRSAVRSAAGQWGSRGGILLARGH